MNAYRNIKRLNRIFITLIRYGFGGLVTELKVLPFLSYVERVFVSKKTMGLSVPVRIRLVLEDLGPMFVKLGQIASTRADLLPPEWIDEFKKLQDMVPAFPYDEARKTVERSLKGQIESRYSSFDRAPVASASIAQVHFARLHDGTEVAVKVKRPGIDAIVEADLSVMLFIAQLLEKYVPASRRYRPVEVVNEFSRVVHNELDFSIEGVNANRFHTIFKDDPSIQIPKVYWDYTTEDVLTLERIHGTPIDEIETLRKKGLDVKEIATRGIEIFFKQVFEHGVFHGDLHPGNIFVRDDGVIIYLDFGIVGRLDRDLRRYLASILYHLIRGDYYKMALIHREMGLIGADVDLHEFEESIRDITEPIFGRTLEQINISTLLMKLIQTARRFEMRLQPNLLLLQKSMVIIEGVGRQLYPDVNMWLVAKPLIYRWMIREKFSPKKAVKEGYSHVAEITGSLANLPVQLHELLERTLKEELRIGFVHHRLGPLVDGVEGAGRMAARGFLAGSLVIGASLYAAFSRGSYPVLGVPVLSWAGFALSAAIGWRIVCKCKKDERR